jgi:putative tryptophan/tyrosine transport system substrate-binding protein
MRKMAFNRKSKIENRKWVGLLVVLVLLMGYGGVAEAQTKGKILRVGVLEPGSPTDLNVCNDGFRQGLHQLGWVEGQKLIFERHYGEHKPDRLLEVAADLVRSAPDVIWTHSPPSVLAAKQATTTIPIVIGVARDLVEHGIVSSLARPGGNITGMELSDSEIIGKRLELLKQTIPKASRVAVLLNPNDPIHGRVLGNLEPDARRLRVQLQRVDAGGPEAFDEAFATIAQWRADALIMPESAMFSANRHRIFELAITKRLPTGAGGPQFADAGSLISYGANVVDICRRSAVFVDKILKGSKPADLPVERPTNFEFVINLKTAKQIGLTIPPNVLARADRVLR